MSDDGKGPLLCIRFRPEDLAAIERRAAEEGVTRTVFIRECALARASLPKPSSTELVFETANGVGRQFCVRFTVDEMDRIRAAATREPQSQEQPLPWLPGPWVRAAVIRSSKQEPPKRRAAGAR